MAINPISVNSSCSGLIKNINKLDSSMKEDTISGIKDGFEDSPEFEWVYINFNFDNRLKTWITNGNMDDKTLGYKTLYSYPYSEIKFKIGDYIHFNYGHEDLNNPNIWSVWLLESLDTQRLYNMTGRLLPCNQELKWVDNGLIYKYPCYLENSMKYTTLNLGTQGFVVPNADILLFVQKNEDTSMMNINKRFIFDGRAFIIVQINNVMNKGYLILFMNKVAESPLDDLKNNIAYNGESIIIENKKNGSYIYPEISSMLLNETIEFNVYKYTDGVVQDNTFDISIAGLDSSYYTLNVIDENNFKVTNIKSNYKKYITIVCKNIESGEIVERAIWLKGDF